MRPLIVCLIAASFASDLALGLFLLLRGGRVTTRRFALAALTVAVFLAAKLALLVALGKGFLAIHLAFLDGFFLVPAVGLALLVASRAREVARPVRAAARASFLLLPIWFYASHVEPYRLVEERVAIPIAAARAPSPPLSIAVLSDIQADRVEDHHRDAVARALAAKPDLILLPGDLVQVPFERFEEVMPEFRALLAPLDAPLGVYFALGNTDLSAQVRRLFEGTRVELLENRIVELEHGGRRVVLGGVDLAFSSPAARATLGRLAQHPREEDLVLLVAHRPDVALALPHASRIDLVVAGHTHGGQVRLPLLGPPITLSDVPRAVAAGGYHVLDGVPIYVSRGIGWEHCNAPRVRFLCPPEVSLLTLGGSGKESADR